jgi:ABC-2 type transport system permease protein
MLSNLMFLFMLTVPILTMRSLSEERKNKTDQLLLTSPISVSKIILGKYFAALAVFLITLVVSFIYPITLFIYGNPSPMEILTGYIGFFLLGAALISVGIFISALCENQVTSAIVTLVVLLAMFIGAASIIQQLISVQWINTVLSWFSVYDRYASFGQGLLSLPEIFYYISFAAVFVFLTIRTVERRRWSEV